MKLESMSVEEVVLEQLAGYNARDINRYAATFSQDLELYNFGEKKPFLTGMEDLIKLYKDIFDNSPELHCKMLSKMILGHTVILEEMVTGRVDKTLELIAIYEVKAGLIFRLTFVKE